MKTSLRFLGAGVLIFVTSLPVSAGTFTTLYAFGAGEGGHPSAPVIDVDGAL